MNQIIQDYLVTFGWAVVGSLGVGCGVLITLKLFDWATPELNEWEEVRKGNIAVGILLAAVVLGAAWVVSSVVRP